MNIVAVIVDEVPVSCFVCEAEFELECKFFDDGCICPIDCRPEWCPIMTAKQFVEKDWIKRNRERYQSMKDAGEL